MKHRSNETQKQLLKGLLLKAQQAHLLGTQHAGENHLNAFTQNRCPKKNP